MRIRPTLAGAALIGGVLVVLSAAGGARADCPDGYCPDGSYIGPRNRAPAYTPGVPVGSEAMLEREADRMGFEDRRARCMAAFYRAEAARSSDPSADQRHRWEEAEERCRKTNGERDDAPR